MAGEQTTEAPSVGTRFQKRWLLWALAGLVIAALTVWLYQLLNKPVKKTRPTAQQISLVRPNLPPPPPKPKPKEPAKPVHPSRVWVQLATGKNVDALGFDWRRLSRSGGDLLAKLKPHTTPWGEAHRLLAGPIDSREKAQALVRELKAKGLDSFLYVSPEGEEIQPVK